MQSHDVDEFSWGADTLSLGQDSSSLLSHAEQGAYRQSPTRPPAPVADSGGFGFGPISRLTACFNVELLKPFFDVNDADVIDR